MTRCVRAPKLQKSGKVKRNRVYGSIPLTLHLVLLLSLARLDLLVPPEVLVSQLPPEVWDLALVLRPLDPPFSHLEPRLQAPQDPLRLLTHSLELLPRT